jgi:hypothetical protein
VRRYSVKAVRWVTAAACASGVIGGAMRALDQSRKRSRSPVGTPSISRITIVGSG